jgi:hypothetical protein
MLAKMGLSNNILNSNRNVFDEDVTVLDSDVVEDLNQ